MGLWREGYPSLRPSQDQAGGCAFLDVGFNPDSLGLKLAFQKLTARPPSKVPSLLNPRQHPL